MEDTYLGQRGLAKIKQKEAARAVSAVEGQGLMSTVVVMVNAPQTLVNARRMESSVGQNATREVNSVKIIN